MFKLANQILDAYDDVTREGLRKLAKLNPQVYVMTSDEHSKLADEDFALSVITKKASKLNRFPIDGEDNTWLSNQYFEMNHEKLPKLAAQTAAWHIKQACDRFGIPVSPAVEGIAKEASSNVYVEEDMKSIQRQPVQEVDLSKFAEVEKIGENYTFAQYVMGKPAHVKVAAQYFEEFSEKMPIATRAKYAAAVHRRSQELGMGKLAGKVAKYAGSGYGGAVDAHLRSRASLLEIGQPKMAAAIPKLAAAKDTMEANEFAKLLHEFDKRAGLDQYYGGYLVDPYQATFSQSVYAGWRHKTASGLTHDEISKVASAKYEKIKEYFGSSVADELRKHGAAIFESLPMDAQETIVGIANGSI